MKEIEAQAEMARLDAARYREASRLLDADDPVERKVKQIQARRGGDETGSV